MTELQGWVIIGLLGFIAFSQWRIAKWDHAARAIDARWSAAN